MALAVSRLEGGALAAVWVVVDPQMDNCGPETVEVGEMLQTGAFARADVASQRLLQGSAVAGLDNRKSLCASAPGGGSRAACVEAGSCSCHDAAARSRSSVVGGAWVAGKAFQSAVRGNWEHVAAGTLGAVEGNWASCGAGWGSPTPQTDAALEAAVAEKQEVWGAAAAQEGSWVTSVVEKGRSAFWGAADVDGRVTWAAVGVSRETEGVASSGAPTQGGGVPVIGSGAILGFGAVGTSSWVPGGVGAGRQLPQSAWDGGKGRRVI